LADSADENVCAVKPEAFSNPDRIKRRARATIARSSCFRGNSGCSSTARRDEQQVVAGIRQTTLRVGPLEISGFLSLTTRAAGMAEAAHGFRHEERRARPFFA
jgi:hypothetical protein